MVKKYTIELKYSGLDQEVYPASEIDPLLRYAWIVAEWVKTCERGFVGVPVTVGEAYRKIIAATDEAEPSQYSGNRQCPGCGNRYTLGDFNGFSEYPAPVKRRIDMREILFRGKRLDDGEWVEGFVIAYIDAPTRMDTNLGLFEVDPATVGQYTGLEDKNGERIFEGDTVDMDIDDGLPSSGVVLFEMGMFIIQGEFDCFAKLFEQYNICTLTGNIHTKSEGGDHE
jgi:uncharacterized phage protein (TIGR01671 family)